MTSLLLHRPPGHDPTPPVDVAGVVTWFGAMQAQDYGSGLWSLGARLPTWRRDDVEAALERREALRTWPMRGTVHLVPPADARWMLDLMGVRALAGARKRREYLGITDAEAEKSLELLAEALEGPGRLTRAECLAALDAGGVSSAGQRGYHLLWYASQRGVTCIAPHRGSDQTFALLEQWAPEQRRLDRPEALATMAVRYFRSHGPTTRQDFSGWTGLTATDAKEALAHAGDVLATVRVEGRDMILDAALLSSWTASPWSTSADDLAVLPGFDEYLLGFKDRSLMVAPEHLQAIIPGGNGVFQPTVVRAGRVVATWKRTTGRARTAVDLRPLIALKTRDRTAIEAAFEPYMAYLDRPVDLRWPS